MVRNPRVAIVLFVGSVVVLGAMIVASDHTTPDQFTGLCVYSTGSFSLLSDGKTTVAVYRPLEVGRVYRLYGRLYNTPSGLKMETTGIENAEPDFELIAIEGAYWPSRGYYLLTPSRVRLAYPIPAEKGELVRLSGIWYGKSFYPLNSTGLGFMSKPEDGMPWKVEGVIIHNGSRTILWNGSEEILLYLPYGTGLGLGERVEVLGIARFYSRLTVIVDSPGDIRFLGSAPRRPLGSAKVGEIGVGECMVTGVGRSLKLNCTEKRLYGFRARVGDTIRITAIVRRSSLRCLDCSLLKPREELPNSICSFKEGELARVRGKVQWLRVYRNGFGIANITHGDCWVLIKLRKSMGVSLRENQTVTAYGIFTTYKGIPAIEPLSGDDVCSGNC